MQLLSRIQALERNANISELYLDRLSSGFMRLNASQYTLAEEIDEALDQIRADMHAMANDTALASAMHLGLLRSILNVTDALTLQMDRAAAAQAEAQATLGSLQALVRGLVIMAAFIVSLLVWLTLRG